MNAGHRVQTTPDSLEAVRRTSAWALRRADRRADAAPHIRTLVAKLERNLRHKSESDDRYSTVNSIYSRLPV